jgi:hypothetical protein
VFVRHLEFFPIFRKKSQKFPEIRQETEKLVLNDVQKDGKSLRELSLNQ